MSDASARRTTTRLSSPPAPEMICMFVERNPKTDRAQVEAMGKLVAEFGATAAKLSPAARQRLIKHKAEFRRLISDFVAQADAEPAKALLVKGAPEVSQGEGLGAIVSATDGQKRLKAYATALKIEDWAGPLAGPTVLEREHGVARSTLHAWQKQGAVIGLLVGVRKHAFPVEQFIDGRPVAGLTRILETIGDPRTAWLWLRQPNPGLAGATPLALLKSGTTDDVLEVAQSNFARR